MSQHLFRTTTIDWMCIPDGTTEYDLWPLKTVSNDYRFVKCMIEDQSKTHKNLGWWWLENVTDNTYDNCFWVLVWFNLIIHLSWWQRTQSSEFLAALRPKNSIMFAITVTGLHVSLHIFDVSFHWSFCGAHTSSILIHLAKGCYSKYWHLGSSHH